MIGRYFDAAADGAKVEAGGVFDGEDNVAVDAAEEGEVGGLRIDVITHRVVGNHFELRLFARLQKGRDVELEGRIAALVGAREGAVYIHLRRLIDRVEGEKDALVLMKIEGGQGARVGAGAAEVVVFAVCAVLGVPGMRERDGLGRFIRLCKQPAVG